MIKTKRTGDNRAQRRLLELLRDVRARETVVIADMTNTLLRQTTDGSGYPEVGRRLHREFLARGGAIVLVTGDSLPVAREQFLKRLAFQGGDLFLVTGGGNRIDDVRLSDGAPRLRKLHLGRNIPIEVQKQLLQRFVVVLDRIAGTKTRDWLALGRKRFLSRRGCRLDVAPFHVALRDICFVEAVSNKITCFFPTHFGQLPLADAVLDGLASDLVVTQICRDIDLHVLRGPNFVDLITDDKGSALSSFFSLRAVARLDLANRVAIIMGDSMNDHPMFAHPSVPCRKRISVYLGGADLPLIPESVRNGFVHLKNAHLRGSELAFRQILKMK